MCITPTSMICRFILLWFSYSCSLFRFIELIYYIIAHLEFTVWRHYLSFKLNLTDIFKRNKVYYMNDDNWHMCIPVESWNWPILSFIKLYKFKNYLSILMCEIGKGGYFIGVVNMCVTWVDRLGQCNVKQQQVTTLPPRGGDLPPHWT